MNSDRNKSRNPKTVKVRKKTKKKTQNRNYEFFGNSERVMGGFGTKFGRSNFSNSVTSRPNNAKPGS